MKWKRECDIDFNKLQWGTLRKYQYFFGIKSKKEGEEIQDREELIAAIKEHFEDFKLDYQMLICKFLKIRKDEKNDTLYNLRRGRRANCGGPSGVFGNDPYNSYV